MLTLVDRLASKDTVRRDMLSAHTCKAIILQKEFGTKLIVDNMCADGIKYRFHIPE